MTVLLLITVELVCVVVLCSLLSLAINRGSRWILQSSSLVLDDTGLQTLSQNIRGVAIIVGLLLSLVTVGFNGWILLQGEQPDAYTLALIQNTPRQVWLRLAAGSGKSICLLVLVGLLQRPLRQVIHRACRYTQQLEQVTANDDSIAKLFQALRAVLSTGMWLLAMIWCFRFLHLPERLSPYLYAVWRIYLIISIGVIVFKSVTVVVDSLDALSLKYSSPNNLLRFYERLQHLVPFLKRCLEYTVWAYAATLVIRQIAALSNLSVYGFMAIQVIAVIFLGRLVVDLSRLIVSELLLSAEETSAEVYQRRITMTPLVLNLIKYVVYFATVLFILKALKIDPGPILAGAGIVGLTVGLGAQSLVKDVVSGFFILFEDYYLVGDFIETEDTKGVVQSIELRTTRILHPDGQLQIVNNGDVGSIVNYSKHPIDAVVGISITYEVNPEQAFDIIRQVGETLCETEADILEPTRIEGIETFAAETCLILTRTRVRPGKHLKVQRLLRQHCLVALLKAGIDIGSMDTKLVLKSGFDQLALHPNPTA